MAEPTSIHWHGLAVPNPVDGVPDVTQPAVGVGTSFVYRFVAPDPGTYWFHPHHGLQLDRGLYAPLIVDDPAEPLHYDTEQLIVIDDWLDGGTSTPEAELRRLKEGGAAMEEMGAMSTSPLLGGDAGDVVYPYHLINGRPLADPLTLEPRPDQGDRVRLRIINAASDTAYRFAIGGHRLTVTHADGFPVIPVEVDALILGMGERYDVVYEALSGAWPVIAVAEGKGAHAGAILRTVDAATSEPPTLSAGAANLEGECLRYSLLQAVESVTLRPPDEHRTIAVELTGGMSAFDWGINGRRYGVDDEVIDLVDGEWVTFNITNTTDMWHPMHLHGHTPQLDASRGGPRKDTVNVLPGSSISWTMRANNPGTWMLHCHNAYHLEGGMATLITYAPNDD